MSDSKSPLLEEIYEIVKASKEKDQEIENLRGEVWRFRDNLKDPGKTILAKDREIANLNEFLDQDRATFDKLNAELWAKEKEIERLKVIEKDFSGVVHHDCEILTLAWRYERLRELFRELEESEPEEES